MKTFIVENWYYLALLVIGLFNIVLAFCKKAKVNLTDSAFEQLLVRLPVMIRQAEETGKAGVDKKAAVLTYALTWLSEITGKSSEVVLKAYSEKVDQAIEEILSTPEKKGN